MRPIRQFAQCCWILHFAIHTFAFQNAPWIGRQERLAGAASASRTRLASATSLVSEPWKDDQEISTSIEAAKDEVLRLSAKLQEDFGVVVLSKDAQVELKDAISALEVCSSSRQLLDSEDDDNNEVEFLHDDWRLVCSTAETPVESLSSILPRVLRSNVLRLSNKYTFHQLKINDKFVQHIYQLDQPNQLNDVFPSINRAIQINPFQVKHSQLVLQYSRKENQENELSLHSIVWNVATARSTRTMANVRVPSRLAPTLSLETVYRDSDLWISRSNLLDQLLVFANTEHYTKVSSIRNKGKGEHDLRSEYMEEIRNTAMEETINSSDMKVNKSPFESEDETSLADDEDGEITFAEEFKSKAQLIVDAFRRKTNTTSPLLNLMPKHITSIQDMIPLSKRTGDEEHLVPDSVDELRNEIAKGLNWTGEVDSVTNDTVVSASDSVGKVAKNAMSHVLSTWSDLLGKHQNGLKTAEKSAVDLLSRDSQSTQEGVQYFVWKSPEKIHANTTKAIADAFFLETLNETLQVESSESSDETVVAKDVLTSWMDDLMPKYFDDEMEAIMKLEEEIADALFTAEEALKASSVVSSTQSNATQTNEGNGI